MNSLTTVPCDTFAGEFCHHSSCIRTAEHAVFRAALLEIQGWDMLNPPQIERVADLAWLRGVVDKALGTRGERHATSAPPKEGT